MRYPIVARGLRIFRLLAIVLTIAIPGISQGQAEGFVPVENGKLFFTEQGQGSPVIMIHGGFLDHHMWDSQVFALSRHYRVIRYDIRAHGQSTSEALPFSDSRDLAALMDFLDIPEAAIVGLSLGGMIAVDFALEHPGRVTSLVLAGPGLSGFDPDSAEILRYVEELTAAAERDDFPAMIELFTRYWFDGPYREPAEVDPVEREKVLEMLAGSRQRWQIFRLASDLDPPAIGRLASIQVPALLVLGSVDMPDIREIVDLMAEEMPNAQRVEIPDTAHMVNMEAPERFNELLIDFLRED